MCLTLQTEQRVEDLERDLVELLDYDQFALVKELTQNRLTIVWCSRLARAENEDEEARIQVRPPRLSFHIHTEAPRIHGGKVRKAGRSDHSADR